MPQKPSKPRAKKQAAKRVPPTQYASYRGNPNYRGRGKRRARVSVAGGMLRGKTALMRFGLRALFVCAILGSLLLIYFIHGLPDIRSIDTIRKQQGITIEAADGHAIANYGDVYGEYLPYDKLPKPLIQAVIATEDRRFFEHHGVDFFGIFRAMVANVRKGHLVQGGSTVTQQVAKNVFLTPERSASRKIQEILLAFWLEARFSKKEIMAIYLNRVYLGAGTFGVDAAAKRYFNKSGRDLNLEESALLAGLLKAPSRYSPASSSQRARDRMHQVLVNMEDAGYLTNKQVAQSLANYTKATGHQMEGGDVRYFTDWVLDDISNYVGQVDEDMVVTTTIDPALQHQAQDALQNVLSKEGPDKHVSQGAIVAMKPDGAVQALIGGMSYADSQYNRATQAKRQPGSSFKLFVYLAALEAGYTPQSIVTDAPITLQVGNKSWSPDNDEKNEYRGDIPLYEALRHSVNTVSVRLITSLGPRRVSAMAERLGIPNVPAYPSIALGAVEATLLEMTGAYAHMPNGGNKVEPYGITRIRTRTGTEIYKREVPEADPVLAKGTVEMMNYMLMDVVRHGTGVKAGLGARPAGGKTGTSQDFKDAWFIGFTPQLVTGVWVGNDDNRSMKKIFGGTLPAQIWHDFMTSALQNEPIVQIPNSAASSEGLLPWLFGSSPPSDSSNEPAASVAPEDAPFGHADPADLPDHGGTPGPEQAPAPVSSETGQPAHHDPDVLTPQFWNKLMDKAPSKKNLEYTYPSDRPGHGH